MDKLTLEARIMDSNIPKSEAEWWAQKEIADLRARLEKAETIAEAARNMITQKGRHNTEIAYKRLENAIAKERAS